MEYIFIFIFGTIIGSFLNVVIVRYNTGDSIINGDSRCFNCGKKLKWIELIPLASFFMQGGKCRNCKSKISWQYPLVEFLTGILFLLCWQITNYSLLITGYYFIIICLLIIIAVYDLRHQIIPNLFVYSFDILSFVGLFQILDFRFNILDFLTGIGLFSFFAFFWLVSKGNWMGLGDAKLALGIGWLLGFSRGISAVFLSFWIGATVGILLILTSRKSFNLKTKLPFAPFLVLGILIVFLFGIDIIKVI